MKTGSNKYPCITRWMFIILFIFLYISSTAQVPTDTLPGDPGNLSVYTIQNISFGAFHPGATGGSVIISPNGSRSVSGGVVALNLGIPFFQSVFEIEAPVGTIVSILNGPNAILTGSNGGTMSLRLNNSQPASPFSIVIPPPGRTQVNIGGTLTVFSPAITIPGAYTGNFYITFNQE